MRTHDGRIISEIELKNALIKVANDLRESAYLIRKEDSYASHVTEEQKEAHLQEQLELAYLVESGNQSGFWLWQRVNQYITGECVAFLPK